MVVRAVKQTAQVVEGEVVLAPEPSFRPPATDALQAQGGNHALAEMPCVPSQAGPLPCPLPLVYVGIPPSVQGTLLSSQSSQEVVGNQKGASWSPQPSLYPTMMTHCHVPFREPKGPCNVLHISTVSLCSALALIYGSNSCSCTFSDKGEV